MRPFLIMVLLAASSLLLAQPQEPSPTVDSLLVALRTAPSDTDSLRAFVHLSLITTGAERMVQARAAYLLARRALERGDRDQRHMKRSLAKACAGMGTRYRQIGALDSARSVYAEGLKAAREAQDGSTESNLLNGLGVVLYQAGEIDSALILMERSLAMRETAGDTLALAAPTMNMASMYHFQGNIPRALELYTRARELAERHNNLPVLSNALVNIGALHESQKELDSALVYYQRALVPMLAAGNTEGLAVAWNNMATVHLSRREFDQALHCVQQGLPIALSGRNHNALSDLYFKKARISTERGDPDGAVEDCERSIAYGDSAGSPRAISYGHLQLAKIERMRGDLRSALRNATRSAEVAGDLGDLLLKKDRAQELAMILEGLGDPGGALAQYRIFHQLADSMTNEKNRKDLVRAGFRYEYGKREALLKAEQDKQDALATREIQKQKLMRNAFIGGFALVAVFAGVFFFQRNRISKARKRSDELLLNILPEEVAEELKDTGAAQARHFDQATILFTDFKGFTQASEKLSPQELVEELNTCFKAFDHIITSRGIEKIKTIGDAYMCTGGLPIPSSSTPAGVVHAALDMQAFMKRHKAERAAAGKPFFEMRVGIHTGPVVAGIVGVKKFAYDIWGDTVNIASRMESSGEVGQVNISEATYALVKDEPGLTCTPRGRVQAKGKGEMEMYFVDVA